MSTWLGIDIGTTAVKVASIRTAYRKMQLVGLASVEVAQPGGAEEILHAVRTAARAVAGDKGAFGDALAVGIDGRKAAVKLVGLPASAAKQVGDVLPFELESALPFDITEAVFDFKVLPGLRDRKGEELAVLVGLAKTEDVRARIDLAKEALALEPERVGLGAFPLGNLVPYVPGMGEGVVAVIDLGTVSSDVVVLNNGEPVFARTLGFGTHGLPRTADKLARELRTTLAAHRAQHQTTPGRVFLCGGGAYVDVVQSFFSAALGLPVDVLPAPALEAALPAEQTATIAKFAKAIGLALGLAPRSPGMNLRRGPLAFERGFAWVWERLPILAVLGGLIFLSFLASAWVRLYAQNKERDALEGALAQVTKEVLGEETASSSRANELLSSLTTVNDEDPMPHADAFDVMVKLSENVPTTMKHDVEELDVTRTGHVTIVGLVDSIPDAQQIETNLAKEPCFAGPKITRTTQQVGGERQKYTLEFDLKCPEDQKKKAKAPSAAAAAPASGTPGGE